MVSKRGTPQPSRAERRRMAKAGKTSNGGLDRLRQDLLRAAGKLGGEEAARSGTVVDAVIDSAAAQGQPPSAVTEYLATGAAAFRAGAFDHETQAKREDGPLQSAACRSGCAFCCVLSGEDGGLITEHEAGALYAALTPYAGQPDGRLWHPRACPALDPDTRMCRAYEARPVICRSYFSTDAKACEAIMEGEERAGAAVLRAYPFYLSIHALARALVGIAKAPTYSLARVAEAAVEGRSLNAALKTAKHAPRVLKEERARMRLGS